MKPVPTRAVPYVPTDGEAARWTAHCEQNRRAAARGVGVAEALAFVRAPGFRWPE